MLPFFCLALALVFSQGTAQTCQTYNIGPCIGGGCPPGSSCTADNVCCSTTPCQSIGPCSGAGQCPSGSTCNGTDCCTDQCQDTTSKCKEWAEHDFCTNPFYTPADKEKCAKTCGLC